MKIFFSKPPPAKKGAINYHFVDRFTFVHFMIGFGYGAFGLGFFWVLLLALIWELIENPLKFYLPFIFPHGTADTLQNATGDFLAVLFGWLVNRYFL